MNPGALTTESTVYVIYIAAAPEAVWTALTSSAFTTRYFFGRSVESDWKTGSAWILRKPDGSVDVHGVVQHSAPPHKLVLSWAVDWLPELPPCVVSYEIETVAGGGAIRLTMTEAHPTPIPVHLLEGGRKGWPLILSGLKTLLETGRALKVAVPAPPSRE